MREGTRTYLSFYVKYQLTVLTTMQRLFGEKNPQHWCAFAIVIATEKRLENEGNQLLNNIRLGDVLSLMLPYRRAAASHGKE